MINKNVFLILLTFYSSSTIGQGKYSNLIIEKYLKLSLAEFSVHPRSFFTDTAVNHQFNNFIIKPFGVGLAYGNKISFKKKPWLNYHHEINYIPFRGSVLTDDSGRGKKIYKNPYLFNNITYGAKLSLNYKRKVFASLGLDAGLLLINSKKRNEAYYLLKFQDKNGNNNLNPFYLGWNISAGFLYDNLFFELSAKDNITKQLKQSNDNLDIFGIIFSTTYYFKKP